MAINDQQEPSADNRIESKRAVLRQCLNDIIVEVENRLREAALNSPIFLSVPNSGDAVVTMATALDPSDAEWSQAVDIVSHSVSERLGGLNLIKRDVICGVAKATMSAADLTAD